MASIGKLLAQLLSGDDEKAEAALGQLAQRGERAVSPILGLLEASNPDHRWWATRVLASLDHPKAQLGLRQALQDRDPQVRQCAALGMRQHPDSQAIPLLIQALSDRDRLLARLAGDALASLGATAIPALEQAAANSHQGARIEAVRALAMMNDPQTIPALFSFLDDRSSLVEYWAEQGLDRLGVGMVFFKP